MSTAADFIRTIGPVGIAAFWGFIVVVFGVKFCLAAERIGRRR
jgi:hypothetical protein